jgi:hypothetical protein
MRAAVNEAVDDWLVDQKRPGRQHAQRTPRRRTLPPFERGLRIWLKTGLLSPPASCRNNHSF